MRLYKPAILFLLLVLTGAFLCCAEDGKDTDGSSMVFIVDKPAVQKSSNGLSSWLIYASVRGYWRAKGFLKENPEAADYRYTFAEEFEARKILIDTWAATKKEKPQLSDAYLDTLLRVKADGFLPEYVWHFFKTPDWGNPPTTMRLTEFDAWRTVHLQDHIPQTLVSPGNPLGTRTEKTSPE